MSEIEIPNHEELEEFKGKRFSRRVALVTAFYAVLLAVTSLGGNNAAKDMMLSQQQSSDQWSFYQSKVMREHIYQLEEKRTRALLTERGSAMSREARSEYEALASLSKSQADRYALEKKEIEKKSLELEKVRDTNKSKDPYFDFAEALLQIAVVMASIAILADSLPVFCISVMSAAMGALLMVNGFLLIFTLPFF